LDAFLKVSSSHWYYLSIFTFSRYYSRPSLKLAEPRKSRLGSLERYSTMEHPHWYFWMHFLRYRAPTGTICRFLHFFRYYSRPSFKLAEPRKSKLGSLERYSTKEHPHWYFWMNFSRYRAPTGTVCRFLHFTRYYSRPSLKLAEPRKSRLGSLERYSTKEHHHLYFWMHFSRYRAPTGTICRFLHFSRYYSRPSLKLAELRKSMLGAL
jgi:polyphosphate kinase 2 (PPK2 family)